MSHLMQPRLVLQLLSTLAPRAKCCDGGGERALYGSLGGTYIRALEAAHKALSSLILWSNRNLQR